MKRVLSNAELAELDASIEGASPRDRRIAQRLVRRGHLSAVRPHQITAAGAAARAYDTLLVLARQAMRLLSAADRRRAR